MSSFLSKRTVEQAASRNDATLAYRVKELSSVLEEQDRIVADGCQVLSNASQSLARVRAKYEPVKEHAAALSSTSTNASQVSSDLYKLSTSHKVHVKV
jgi:hypothetical protein